jgi:hypothetical protein
MGIAAITAGTSAHAISVPDSAASIGAARTQAELSGDEVLQKISMLRRRVGLGESNNILLLLGKEQLEAACFGQATGGGACTYSQESGCNYTQNCGGAGGTKGALQG